MTTADLKDLKNTRRAVVSTTPAPKHRVQPLRHSQVGSAVGGADPADLEASTFQKRPCYRYLRASDKLPTYDEIASVEDPVCPVKLFNPTGIGTWWIAAYDPDTRIAWGVCSIFETEIGSVPMDELVEFRGRFGLPIERDLGYRPARISEVLDLCGGAAL